MLMDCNMPVLDGLEATARLTAMIRQGKIPPVPIIGLSAFSEEAEIQRCHDVGMVETLLKPLSFSKLKEKLAQYHLT